jgi:hypothetical protein
MWRATASCSRPNRARAAPSIRTERRAIHVRTHSPLRHRAAMARDAGGARHGRARHLQLQPPADRRRPGHHQRPGADQHLGARLFAAGNRAARHLSAGGHHGRPAGPGADPFAVALRPVADHGDLQGRHRHLLRAPARQPAHPGGQGQAPGRRGAGHGPDLHRPRRDLPVDRGSRAGCAQAGRHAIHAHRPARDPGLGHQAAAAQRAGVTEINSIGGFAKEYLVAPSPKSWPRTA